MLARKLLAVTLILGLAATSSTNGYGQSEEKEDKKIAKRAVIKKRVNSNSNDNVDEELQKKVMGQLKKSLKKFEKELGEKKIAGILKSVEQNLSGNANEFHFEFKGVDSAEIHRKMAEQLGKLDRTMVLPHHIELQGLKNRKMIGVMLMQEDGEPVKIQKVIKGSAAEKAGIKAGDVIIKVNGKKVDEADSLSKQVQSSKGAVKIEVKRDGKNMTVKVEPKNISSTELGFGSIELNELAVPHLKIKKGGEVFEIHKDMIKKVMPKDGKPHGIIMVNPGDGKKKIEWKIDRDAENKKSLLNKAEAMKDQIKKRIEIRSDLSETLEELKKQMKEMQAEIKKLKQSKN